MTKAHSPVLGFNTNVRHKGKVFHIQTEDSGAKHPHIITHVFADGGRILKSVKTSYAEHLGEENLVETVRAMMKEQHKAMFMALRDGSFDSLVDGTGAPATAPEQAVEPAPTSPAPVPGNALPASAVAASPHHPAAAPDSRGDREPRPVAPAARSTGITQSLEEIAAAQAWTANVKVDIGVFERAAAQDGAPANVGNGREDMPPPPPTVLSQARPAGTYRAITPHNQNAAAAGPPSSRYVASRPAAIFATARPSESGNVFGEEAISDKSLDEVILSFLSEEFGSKPDSNDGGKR